MAVNERHNRLTLFSWWHRRALPIIASAIDIDSFPEHTVDGCCRLCNRPLYFIEDGYDVGQPYKAGYILGAVAERCSAFAFVALVTESRPMPRCNVGGCLAADPCACRPGYPEHGCQHGIAQMRIRVEYQPVDLRTLLPDAPTLNGELAKCDPSDFGRVLGGLRRAHKCPRLTH